MAIVLEVTFNDVVPSPLDNIILSLYWNGWDFRPFRENQSWSWKLLLFLGTRIWPPRQSAQVIDLCTVVPLVLRGSPDGLNTEAAVGCSYQLLGGALFGTEV